MLSHDTIWQAIDRLAQNHNLSPSGLARMAGLDATIFNPSKRVKANGRPRWPSTESISKILQATNTPPWLFFLPPFEELETRSLATGQINANEKLSVTEQMSSSLHLVQLDHSRLSPCYDQGDLLLLSMERPLATGDIITTCTINNELMIYRFQKESLTHLYLINLERQQPFLLQKSRLSWWAKILWVAK